MSETTEKSEVIVTEAAPFADLSKKQMIEHLIHAHRISRIYGQRLHEGTKITKDDLISEHKRYTVVPREYEFLDSNENGYRVKNLGTGNVFTLNGIPHVHTVLAATTSDQAIIDAAKSGDAIKVKMSSSEISRLTKLVDNDFANLKSEMQQFAADMREEKRQEVKAQFAEAQKGKLTFITKAEVIQTKAFKALQELRNDADEAGIALEIPLLNYGRNYGTGSASANVKALEAAQKKAEAEVNEMLTRGLMSLEQQRLTAQRKVLMAGISEQAMQVLSTVPSAKELMVVAARDKAAIQS